MTCPQCPQIKSSPPVPDILLSVRRIERFIDVTGPTGIIGIVAIFFPHQISAGELSSKLEPDQPDCAICLIFASGDMRLGHREPAKRSAAGQEARRDGCGGKRPKSPRSEKHIIGARTDPYE